MKRSNHLSLALAVAGILATSLGIAPAQADEPEARDTRFYFRAGVIHIHPFEIAGEVELDDINGAASLAVENGPIMGSGADVDNSTIPGGVIGWVTPWLDRRLALELVVGVPFIIEIRQTGTIANESLAPEVLGGIPTGVPALGREIGETKAAPPTVTAVYRFAQKLGPVQPYVGAGLTLLLTFDTKVTNPILTEVRAPDLSIAPAPGLVLQSGLETRLWGSFWASIDVKFIGFMLARARLENIVVRAPDLPLYEEVEVGTAKMNVWLNPIIVQLGVGMDF